MRQAEELRPAPVRLGMLVPSSNTVVEPLTAAMVSGLPEVSVHFSRFRVIEISLSENSLAQFDLKSMLAAARLLADARVHVITWNGTSAAWKGFVADEELCCRITQETGIPATSSVLALSEAFEGHGIRRFGLVTPYIYAVQAHIIANYGSAGFHCVAERHGDRSYNVSFAQIPRGRIAALGREVAAAGPQAIAIICTNLRGSKAVAELEAKTGLPVYDTVATGLWQSLRLAGVDPARVVGWGSLFAGRVPKAPDDQRAWPSVIS